MAVCKFWSQGYCRYGDSCRFEHPPKGGPRNNANRYAPLQESASPQSHGRRADTRTSVPTELPYLLRPDGIIDDLTKERPQWILSAYSPGRNTPVQLFGGYPREQSFEEVRLLHYQAAAAGQAQQAVQQSQNLIDQAEQQMKAVLANVDGAIRFIINGEQTHPNRNDICADVSRSASAQNVQGAAAPAQSKPTGAGGFGKPSDLKALAAAPSSFGQPSQLGGGTSAFGRPSILGGAPSAFGQPSRPGAGLGAFGKPSPLGPAASAFGQPTQLGVGQPTTGLTFGQPSNLGGAQIQAQIQPTPGVFGQSSQAPSNTGFGQASQAQSNQGFGQASQAPSNQGFPQSNANNANNPFGAPSTAPAASSGFGQPSAFGRPATFGAPSAGVNPFATAPNTGGGPNNTNGIALSTAPNSNGTSTRDASNRLLTWKGRPVQYVGDEPFYLRDDSGGGGGGGGGSGAKWERIWFPDGPPALLAEDTQLPAERYDAETQQAFVFARQHGFFKDGRMPLLPPRQEWCSWDF